MFKFLSHFLRKICATKCPNLRNRGGSNCNWAMPKYTQFCLAWSSPYEKSSCGCFFSLRFHNPCILPSCIFCVWTDLTLLSLTRSLKLFLYMAVCSQFDITCLTFVSISRTGCNTYVITFGIPDRFLPPPPLKKCHKSEFRCMIILLVSY